MIFTAAELAKREEEVLAMIDETRAYEHIDDVIARATKRDGRPRVLSTRALLFAVQMASTNGDYFINQLPDLLNNLSAATQRELSIYGHTITWRQVQYLFTRIDRVLRPSITNEELDDEQRYGDFDRIFSAIATAGAHADSMNSLSVAIDGSDIATWAKTHYTYKKFDDTYEVVKKVTDSDAGSRPRINEEDKAPFFGYEVTVATAVKDLGGPTVPKAAKAARFRPTTKSDIRTVALSALREVKKRQGALGDVLVDRGYTSSNDGKSFLIPVRQMGGEPVFDLLNRQVGTSGTVHGAIIIDGRPYSPSIPKALRNLKPPRSKGTNVYHPNPDEVRVYEEKIALREIYAMVPHGRVSDDLRLVMQCPGAAGKLSCPLQPPKVAPRPGILPINTQPKTALPHSVCASRYKTFDLVSDIPLYQREVYGSTAWRKSYARRGTSVESNFSGLKDDAMASLHRGKIRMRGLIKTGLLVAAALASANRRYARSWDRQFLPAPPTHTKKVDLRDPYYHRLTRITRRVAGVDVVVHPLTT